MERLTIILVLCCAGCPQAMPPNPFQLPDDEGAAQQVEPEITAPQTTVRDVCAAIFSGDDFEELLILIQDIRRAGLSAQQAFDSAFDSCFDGSEDIDAFDCINCFRAAIDFIYPS